jgi:acyl-homoserine-lactone acylase
LTLFNFSGFAQKFSSIESKIILNHRKNVEISRDNYGVPHINGKTDADAVFGLMFAQCEDDFYRIEKNYIEKLGWQAKLDSSKVYDDLFSKILFDQNEAKSEYLKAPKWLKDLLNAHATAINYFLSVNPQIKPLLIKHFEPWYPLLWTDGSIGAVNTADITVNDLKQYFGKADKLGFSKTNALDENYEQTGSNGFAIGPAKSLTGKAMLYINPHTTFYFRPEVHVKSQNGLNAYGAVTWGQFFVYQGFNEYCGWMHTSSNADVSDTFFETLKTVNNKTFFKLGQKWLPVKTKKIRVDFLSKGVLSTKYFTVNFTQNGPILGIRDGKPVSLRSFNRSQRSLEQSWLRTKAKGFDEYQAAMNLKANTSNNTVFADKNGNIAYWHGNYMPVRDPKLNWSLAQDGSLLTNKYQGLHDQNQMIWLKNPQAAWLQNCNSTPFTVAGTLSPKRENYPDYMAPDGENFRGITAVKLLGTAEKLDLESLIKLGYNTYLSAFEILIGELKNRKISSVDPETQEALDSLYAWNYHSAANSIATTLAIEWAQKLNANIRKVYVDQGQKDQVESTKEFIKNERPEVLVYALSKTLSDLKSKFGTWKKPWGEFNRFQRINEDDDYHNDGIASYPVAYASALWGALPSFNSKVFEATKLRYGYSGNSFVCAVEFGDKIRAKSLLAGGNNSDKNSPYFNNQGFNYSIGKFKDVYFYEEDIKQNTIKKYKP